MNCPIDIDTDDNESFMGKATFGSIKGFSNLIYITIGTGEGEVITSEGKLFHGMMQPEGGDIILTKSSEDKGEFICPNRDNCFEGLMMEKFRN